jgi:putative two-component system response regulator
MIYGEVIKEKLKILIVDDVESNRFVLRDIVSEMGYQPILAENGEQAFKIVEHFQMQLIILDISMPVMDGYEFCERMKSSPETRDIPIIFISAFDNPKDIVKGFELGGEDYITKPFIPEVVKARVGVHLRLYEANRDLVEINRKLQVSVNEQVKQIEMEKKNILYALLRIARENACYDEQHMEKISYNCRILAEAMQLSTNYGDMISDTYIDTIELSAPLCDLGNLTVPASVLQKDTDLDEEETKIMQEHTTNGAKILTDIQRSGDYNTFLEMSIEIANFHHENWDGTGYPEGRKGGDIPLSAQIVYIISEYCALMEKRTYRGACCNEDALKEMEKDVGVKFNPDIFQILCKISRQLR